MPAVKHAYAVVHAVKHADVHTGSTAAPGSPAVRLAADPDGGRDLAPSEPPSEPSSEPPAHPPTPEQAARVADLSAAIEGRLAELAAALAEVAPVDPDAVLLYVPASLPDRIGRVEILGDPGGTFVTVTGGASWPLPS